MKTMKWQNFRNTVGCGDQVPYYHWWIWLSRSLSRRWKMAVVYFTHNNKAGQRDGLKKELVSFQAKFRENIKEPGLMGFKNRSISPSQSLPADYQSTQRATCNRNMSEKPQLHLDLFQTLDLEIGEIFGKGKCIFAFGKNISYCAEDGLKALKHVHKLSDSPPIKREGL